jgi:[ribosomal protein S18]-alanine N-acetyltransferase
MTAADLLQIVPATARHADDLARLHAPLFVAPWSAAGFAELLAHPGALAFLAVAGPAPAQGRQEAAGFILGRLAADEAEILSLGVALAWQRRGLGRRLVEELVRAATERGARRLCLEVGAGNTAARALYGGLGFRESGRRRGYYVHPGLPPEDAINLHLAL